MSRTDDEEWIVVYACQEAVIRIGSLADVWQPDDLGCAPVGAYQVRKCELLAVWEKGEQTRVRVVLPTGEKVG
jgi:hypothetical protein